MAINITNYNNHHIIEYVKYVSFITQECNRLGMVSPYADKVDGCQNFDIQSLNNMEYKNLYTLLCSMNVVNTRTHSNIILVGDIHLFVTNKQMNLKYCSLDDDTSNEIYDKICESIHYLPNLSDFKLVKIINLETHKNSPIYTFIPKNFYDHTYTAYKGKFLYAINS